LRDIEAQCSFEELVAVGLKRGEFLPVPPEIDSMVKFMEVAPQIYLRGLRDTAPEDQISVEKLDINHYRLTYNVPFPPFVMYGSTYGLLRKVQGNDPYPIVTILNDDTPYVFDIKW
jgi:hypothetical protein